MKYTYKNVENSKVRIEITLTEKEWKEPQKCGNNRKEKNQEDTGGSHGSGPEQDSEFLYHCTY